MNNQLETVSLLICTYLTCIPIYLTVAAFQVVYLCWTITAVVWGDYITATIAVLIAATYFYFQIPLSVTKNGHGRPS